MSSTSTFTDAQFDEILEIVALSGDLRSGVGKSTSHINEALYTKLAYTAVTGMDALLEELAEELQVGIRLFVGSALEGSAADEFVSDNSKSRKELTKQALLKIQSEPEKERVLIRLMAAFRSIKEYIEEASESPQNDDVYEFAEQLLSWITEINWLRVAPDILPLVQLGLYATEVRQALDFWNLNRDDPAASRDENVWQKELSKHLEVLQRALGGRVVLLHPQAHVGVDGIDGKGDRITDFLLNHQDTRNVFLVEIKTPSTDLLGKEYRKTYPLSSELSGAVGQVLLQRHDLMTNFYSKAHNAKSKFNVAAPRCIVIAGCLGKELENDENKRLAFEMQRQAVEPAVRIIGFDELYHDFASFHLLGSSASTNPQSTAD